MRNHSEEKSPSPPPPKASRTKRVALYFFNPIKWSDWTRTKSIFKFFLEMIERYFVRRKINKKHADFNQIVKKLNLNDEALEAKRKGLLRLSYSLLGLGLFLFGYTIYQLLYGSFKGVLVSLIEIMIALVLAFRYHYWAFQIQQQKLGCSVKKWFQYTFSQGGKP